MTDPLAQAELFQLENGQAWYRKSPDGLYRYVLGRRWGEGPMLGYCGLNPSIAALLEDPTSRRFRSFGQREGCGAYEACNVDAWIATEPADLRRAAAAGQDVTGPENDQALLALAGRALRIVLCWGGGGRHRLARVRAVLELLEGTGVPLVCFGYTEEGHPRHPLYLPKTEPLRTFERLGDLAP